MTRTLKALGLAVLAVCALWAVSASSAAAETHEPTCTEHPTCDVTATGTATFGTKSSSLSVTCTTEEYHATVTNGDADITVTPTYSGCTALGGNATIDTTGCTYTLTGETTSHNKTTTGTETDAPVDVNCGAGTLKITATACTISIGTQNGKHGIIYDKEGSGPTEDVKVTATVDGISYTSSGFGCAIAGIPSSGTDGTLTGSATATATVDTVGHTTEHTALGYHTV